MVGVHGRVPISFMLTEKRKYLVMNQDCQLLFFRFLETLGIEN